MLKTHINVYGHIGLYISIKLTYIFNHLKNMLLVFIQNNNIKSTDGYCETIRISFCHVITMNYTIPGPMPDTIP